MSIKQLRRLALLRTNGNRYWAESDCAPLIPFFVGASWTDSVMSFWLAGRIGLSDSACFLFMSLLNCRRSAQVRNFLTVTCSKSNRFSRYERNASRSAVLGLGWDRKRHQRHVWYTHLIVTVAALWTQSSELGCCVCLLFFFYFLGFIETTRTTNPMSKFTAIYYGYYIIYSQLICQLNV